ncbi:MAG: phosphatase PAP2 family protein [Anaerolineae bacterium]|nr:phosphatase PAP2 family protein [Anaerolineae bacterium]
MNGLQEFGIALIQSLQTLSPALDIPMNIFTFMGTIEFYMVFITLIYWVINAQLGFRVFMILLTTDIFASAFKQLLHQPRPYWVGDVKGLGMEESYGIPSSHASDSLSVWGYLAYRTKKRWLWITAVLLIFLIAFSRLYLGVHFPHDILFGWAIGLMVLLFFINYEKTFTNWISSHSIQFQIWYSFFVSLIFIAIGYIVQALIAGSTDPSAWSHLSTEARSLTHYFTLAGAFFGAAAGYALMKIHAPFKVAGSGLQRTGRYLVGIIGVFALLYGLDPLFSLIAADETSIGYFLRYIRYGVTTLWVIFGAPWVFLKLNLAASQLDTRHRH